MAAKKTAKKKVAKEAEKKTVRKTNGGAGGRPVMQFDIAEVEKLGKIGATYIEMAAWFDCSLRVIESRMGEDEADLEKGKFKRAYKKGKGFLTMSIRRKQIDLAHGGNPTMLIWMGKQLLGQTDKLSTKNEVKVADTAPIIHLTAKKPKKP